MADVLVTGGCGYIGSVLIPQLLADDRVATVRVLDSLAGGSPTSLLGCFGGSLEFVEGDVREYDDVESAARGIDTVIHLAAITGARTAHDRSQETVETNYRGSANVLDAAVACDVGRFVFASSCNVYGRAAAEELSEESAADPINPYAASKLDAETLVAEASAQSSMSATSLRMSTVFGTAPGMRFNLVVNQFVFRAVTGRRLTVYGDGTNWRPFVHVEDAARAYREAALAPSDWPAAVYNVGDGGQNLQIDEVAATVRDLVGPVDLRYLEQEDPGPSYHVNFDRLGETGYQTEHSVSGGIEDLAAQLRGSESLEPSR